MTDNFISLNNRTIDMENKTYNNSRTNSLVTVTEGMGMREVPYSMMSENFKYQKVQTLYMENKNTTTDKQAPFFNGAK